MVGVSGLRSGDHFLVGGVEPTITDIFHDRGVVQPGILQDHAEHAAQIVAAKNLSFLVLPPRSAPVCLTKKPHPFFPPGVSCPPPVPPPPPLFLSCRPPRRLHI